MKSRNDRDLNLGFSEMLSALPDAEPELPPPTSPRRAGNEAPEIAAEGGISELFAALPEAAFRSSMQPAAPAARPERQLRPAVRPPVRPSSLTPITNASPAGEYDCRTISQQILDQLEQYNLLATCQLRIEVHNGVVVALGEVPGAYEKQLVAHFCRKVEGVVKYVDSLTVRPQQKAREKATPARGRRPVRQAIEWRLPFRAWHAAAALGLVVLAWGAISLGRGHGGPERLPVFPLTGTLVIEGQPAAGAAIVLYPEDESISARPRASVGDDGTFAVTTYEPGDGAPPGEYKVTVEWRRPPDGHAGGGDDLPPPNVLPAAYSNPRTTPLVVAVEETENDFPPITFRN